MIQVITGDSQTKEKFKDEKKYFINDFKSPKAFDDFDVNILDLSFSELWENKRDSTSNINMIKDLVHYSKIINNANNTKVLIILPQNISFKYCYYNNRYQEREYLKNLLQLIEKLVSENIYPYCFQMEFETTYTTLKNIKLQADFHFCSSAFEKEKIILTSDKSNKITTVSINDNLYYTTLNIISSKEGLEEFLLKSKIISNHESKVPEWIHEVDILDDKEIKNNIRKIEQIIEEQVTKKEVEINKLKLNDKIKRILYQTDKELQKEVIEVINELLEYEDGDFIDEMEEDYRVKKENITFIIETKGLLRNIKGEDISKTSNHVEMYLDKLEEDEIQENVKGLYIVATQRNKKIEERDRTPDRQVTLARRDNILIIRTEELLKLFEAFRNRKIKTKDIIKFFSEQIGEFKYSEE